MNTSAELEPKQSVLRERLLLFGGKEVEFGSEAYDVDELLEWGREFPRRHLRHPKMHDSCHENAASLWFSSRGRNVVGTGYALDENGNWRVHSWVIKDDRIIETLPGRRLKYFGVELFGNQLMEFAYKHLHPRYFFEIFSRNAVLLGFENSF